MANCFHCGLPASDEFKATIKGEEKHFCCFGCQAVTQAIASGGLYDFYQFRDENNLKADDSETDFTSYDLDEVQQEFVYSSDSNSVAKLNIGGITCVACAWLIEKHLQKFPSIDSVKVHVASHSCEIIWDKNVLQLSEIFREISRIGYRAFPATNHNQQQILKEESRSSLIRLGIAGITMMQIGMVAIALHAGAIQGIEPKWEDFLRWISLLFAIPVMFVSARPFFRSAYNGLKLKSLNMDLPVSIALGIAFIASAWATFTGTGEVYFDSIAMFTFFLLLGRYFEMQARHSDKFSRASMSSFFPLSVERIVNTKRERVSIRSLEEGDKIWVGAGDVVPCDGVIEQGHSHIDESFLTGESKGLAKGPLDAVFAGSINMDTALTIRVEKTGGETGYAAIERLVERGISAKPPIAQIADRLASYFVFVVLVLSIVVGGFWWSYQPENAIWVVLSILVVTCPCALSLATPVALTVGVNTARKLGFLVQSSHFIEGVTTVDKVVFDKTGTLTHGRMQVLDIKALGKYKQQDILQIIASLEAHSSHPIANAFLDVPIEFDAENVRVYPSLGIEGSINNEVFRFGNSDFISSWGDKTLSHLESANESWHILATKSGAIGGVLLGDSEREGSASLVEYLNEKGIEQLILSGDNEVRVREVAKKFSISNFFFKATPEKKLATIDSLQSDGDSVLMIGDGINDAPVLGRADVSIALGSAAQIAKTHADGILLNENLSVIASVIKLAHRVKLTIKQNFIWALSYNAVALPAAAMGLIPPYLAALGMSASSLIVVLNSLRISRSIKH